MEILNSYPILVERNTVLGIVACLCLMISPLLLGILINAFPKNWIIILILLIDGLLLISMIYFSKKVPSGRLEYQVIISDDYSAKDLYEKYEVIKTEGKIWYIQDKEKSNADVDDK